jgi:large subunit ribosomal protein L7A
MKYVGIKQVLKAVETGEVNKVYIGKDADMNIVGSLVQSCKDKNIEIIEIDSMEKLGQLAGIEVKAATAAE